MAETTTSSPSWLDKILQFGTAAIQLRSQQQIQSVQVKRAQAGLPLLDVEKLAPPVRATVGVSSDTAGLMRTGMLVGGGLLAAFLVAKLVSGRRR